MIGNSWMQAESLIDEKVSCSCTFKGFAMNPGESLVHILWNSTQQGLELEVYTVLSVTKAKSSLVVILEIQFIHTTLLLQIK
jgi:hypothetical protein